MVQYGTYPSDFEKSDKQALRKRSKFFKSADGNLYYVGGGKQDIAICKHQCKHQVIISDDENDPEGKSQSDCYLLCQ